MVSWFKELKTEIRNLVEIRKQEHVKKYGLNCEKELEVKADILNRLLEVIKSSDYSNVSKTDLINLCLELSRARSLSPYFEDEDNPYRNGFGQNWQG